MTSMSEFIRGAAHDGSSTSISEPKRHAACDECSRFIGAHYRRWINADHMLLNREAEAQMLRRADGLFSLLETVHTMPLLRTEAHGSAAQEESTSG